MQSIRIDGTDLTVSRIAFGTGSLHHLPRASDRRRVLDTALDCGMTHFDTSPYYGFGLAERELGAFLRNKRDRITVASKVGIYPPGRGRGSVASIWARKIAGRVLPGLNRARVDGSLRLAQLSFERTMGRFKRDHLDLLYLHEPDAELLETEEMERWLRGLQASGRIREFGLAGETPTLREWAIRDHPLARVIQTRDSVVRREADFLTTSGRAIQFTYGYASGSLPSSRCAEVYREALERNSTGAVLMSTRKPARILEVAAALE
jgi:aryl-alcohol dehydrogenase-like predicted oxidoreductase